MIKKRHTGKNLLVMRLSAMGDVAMSVPVVAALRASYPDLGITILTRTSFRDFFRHIPNLSFIDFDPAKRHKGLMGLVRLSRDIRRRGIDRTADLHDVLRTKVIRRLLLLYGIPATHIDKGRREKRELTRRTGKRLVPLQPMTERYREVIARLGYDFRLEENPLRTPSPVPNCIIEATGGKSGKWIGVAPFAKHKGKIYPIPLVDELIGLLNKKYERVFIFGGGEHEKSFALGMEKRHEGVVSVIGKMSMTEEMDLIGNLDAIITMDSATMHIASIVGAPVVSVWGATHPYAGFYGYGQNPANAVQTEISCRPCSVFGNKPCIFGDYRCLSAISPETILQRVEEVTGLSSRPKDSGAEARTDPQQ